MYGVCSLSNTVDITFILPKIDLKKPTKKQLNFSNSIFCSAWKTEQLFIFFFSLIIPKSTLQSSITLKIAELLLTANSPNLSDLKIWTVIVNG